MHKLEFLLLSGSQILVDGNEVTNFNTRKDRALLIYLAVTGKAHSREHLAGLLWSDLPDGKALRNLRHTLAHLRKVLNPAWLRVEQGIALAPDLQWQLDVQTVRAAVGDFIRLSKEQINQQRVDMLYTGLKLYRGEFLQGFYLPKADLFEEWVVMVREELHLLVLQGLELVAHYALAEGRYEQGIAASRHLLRLEASSERGQRMLIELLACSGQRAAALAQYEQHREHLAAEFNIEPMPETTAVWEQIQQGTYRKASFQWQPAQPIDPSPVPLPPNNRLSQKPTVSTNLHRPLAAFIGRQWELEFINERLGTSDCRLLTIAGLGGMGKSSLALALGQHLLESQKSDFPDGIFWVPLADLNRPAPTSDAQTAQADKLFAEAIYSAIATQINAQLDTRLASSLQLQSYLHTRRLLLILDNFEHLVAGVDAITTLLAQAPELKIIVTSRIRLNVRGETVLPLNSLSLPTPAYLAATEAVKANPKLVLQEELWQTSEAVTMFIQRAQQQDPAFTVNAETLISIGEICRLVEGLPLGIELAASMLPILNCTTLAAALVESLDFLVADTRDLPSAQRTLAAVFEHSWRLLQPQDQLLLAKFAIFSGTFAYEAAAEIVGATNLTLKQLVNQSLLSHVRDNRYTMHRTVRAFAYQKLQEWPEQHKALQVQFVHFFLAFVARQEETLTTSTDVIDLKSIQAELEQILNAWRWAVQHQIIPPLTHALYAIFLFYEQNGFYLEIIDLCEQTVRAFSPLIQAQNSQVATEATLLLGRLQTFLGLWYFRLGKFTQAQAALASSWSILATADDSAAALCLILWGHTLSGHDTQRAKALLHEGQRLVQTSDVAWIKALGYQIVGEINILCGNYAEAEAQIAKGVLIAGEINKVRAITSGHKALGRLNLARGHYQQAEEHLRTSIELAHQYQFRYLCLESVIMLGEALRHQGQFAEAKLYFDESREIAGKLGAELLLAPILWEEGCLAEQRGDYALAKTRFTESLAIGLPNWWIHALPTFGWALIGLGEEGAAQHYFKKILADAEAKERIPIALDAQAGLAYIAVRQTKHDQASSKTIEQFVSVLRTIEQHPAATQETRTRVARLAVGLGSSR